MEAVAFFAHFGVWWAVQFVVQSHVPTWIAEAVGGRAAAALAYRATRTGFPTSVEDLQKLVDASQRRSRREVGMLAVELLHAVMASHMALTSDVGALALWEHSPASKTMLLVTGSYFAWDFAAMVHYGDDWDVLNRAQTVMGLLACLAAGAGTSKSFAHFTLGALVMMQVSSVFLHLMVLCSELDRAVNRGRYSFATFWPAATKVCRVLFVATFAGIRLVWIPFKTVQWINVLGADIGNSRALVLATCIVGYNTVNWMWGFQMARGLYTILKPATAGSGLNGLAFTEDGRAFKRTL